jgi:hypothetical protein
MLKRLINKDVNKYIKEHGCFLDSRGIQSNTYYKFAIIRTYYEFKLKKITPAFKLENSFAYIILIDYTEYNQIQSYNSSLLPVLKNCDITFFNHESLSDSRDATERLYYQKTGAKTASKMPMYDISGRELKLGDLVIYFKGKEYKSDNETDYGICVSSNQVYTANGKVVKVMSVYKPVSYTKDEEDLQNKLTLRYTQRSLDIQKTKQVDVSEGMVFKTDKYLYIYLGNCTSQEVYFRPSRYDFATQLDGTKSLYLKVKINGNDSNEFILTDDFVKNIELESVSFREQEIRNNRVILEYYSLRIEKNFVSRLPSNAVYLGESNIFNQNIKVVDDISVKFLLSR